MGISDEVLSLDRHENVRRLDFAADDPFLVRVLHALADLAEEFEALLDG